MLLYNIFHKYLMFNLMREIILYLYVKQLKP